MTKQTILIVEDEDVFRNFLGLSLTSEGYETVEAENGMRGLEILQSGDIPVDLILLDRQMPGLNGIEVLKEVKSDAAFSHIPVVMQTAADRNEDIVEGIEAGAYYYLIKPFKAEVMLSIVKAALDDRKRHRLLQEEVSKNSNAISLMEFGSFEFKDPSSAHHLATFLALMCPNPEAVVIGLGELMMNAIEHGNLAIDYGRKTELIDAQNWESEIDRLLGVSEHKDKKVSVTVLKPDEKLEFRISDEGGGFEWQNYIDLEPDRARDLHGRGIALANKISFDSLTYEDNGATAIATVPIVSTK